MEEQLDLKKLVEAALFMSTNAMSVGDIVTATGIASPGKIQAAAKELVEEYRSRDTALEIIEIDSRYMFSLKAPYANKVSGLSGGPDMSRGALRILAYVSKNEDITQSELVKTFGASAYDNIKELLEKRFVETAKYKRTKKVNTTSKFKEYFSQG